MPIDKIKHNGTEYKITEEDSGWIVPELSSAFVTNSNSWATITKFRKVGNVVEITGTISPATELSETTTERRVFTLPEGYRPEQMHWFHCQGAVMNTCCVIVRTDGQVTLSRYGVTDKGAMPTSGIAFIQCTFLVD